MRIREIAQARVRYGYRKMRVLLNREGWDVGKYLVYRLYTEEGLTLKRMKPAGKRKASRTREDRIKPTARRAPALWFPIARPGDAPHKGQCAMAQNSNDSQLFCGASELQPSIDESDAKTYCQIDDRRRRNAFD